MQLTSKADAGAVVSPPPKARRTLGGKSVSFIESGRNATALLDNDDDDGDSDGKGDGGGKIDGEEDKMLNGDEIEGEGIV